MPNSSRIPAGAGGKLQLASTVPRSTSQGDDCVRDFSWRYFTMTGDIEAYLLFKEEQALQAEDDGVDRRAKADVADVYATQS